VYVPAGHALRGLHTVPVVPLQACSWYWSQGQAAQLAHGVPAAVQGPVCTRPAAQAAQGLHTVSLLAPHAASWYCLVVHTEQGWHCVSARPLPAPLWYRPAPQGEHALHWMSLVALQGATW
jgi:hypothetical protein